MGKPFELRGIIDAQPAPHEGMLHEWRREKQRLEEETLSLRRELDDARAQNEKLERSLRNLRQQLSPLHRALRAVFGEIELAIGEEPAAAASSSSVGTAPENSLRWESFKTSFPGAPARIVDALLAHRELTITQLSTVLKAHYSTVKNACLVLSKAGAINKDGRNGAYRLNS